MSAIAKKMNDCSIFNEIESHSAWKGHISGIHAEKMLRGKNTPFLYVLRAGEHEKDQEVDYYITFIDADLKVRHQPFIITTTSQGWCFEQGGAGGPYPKASINDVIHLIIHSPKGAPVPFTRFAENA